MDSNEYLVFAIKKIQLGELICQPLNVAYFFLFVLEVVNRYINLLSADNARQNNFLICN